MTITSDGTTASYYELPEGCTELQDLISHRNLNAQDGEMFRAIYRKGRASHSDELRDARKVLFYAQAEVKRLEALRAMLTDFGQQHTIEPAAAIDDESPRQQIIQQNGEMAEEVYAAIEKAKRWEAAPEEAMWRCGDREGEFWFKKKPFWSERLERWEYPGYLDGINENPSIPYCEARP